MTLYGSRQPDAWRLLRTTLWREHGFSSLPPVLWGEQGKPYFPQFPGLCFNLSHSPPYSLCALSNRPVGVDVERIRPRRPSLVTYALKGEELTLYQALGGDWPAFFTLWTRREAWSKYTGGGLMAHWRETPPSTPFPFYKSYAGEDWRGAVWGEEPPPPDILWLEDLL